MGNWGSRSTTLPVGQDVIVSNVTCASTPLCPDHCALTPGGMVPYNGHRFRKHTISCRIAPILPGYYLQSGASSCPIALMVWD